MPCAHFIEALQQARNDVIVLSQASPGERKKAVVKCPVENCLVYASAIALNGTVQGLGVESIVNCSETGLSPTRSTTPPSAQLHG
ncbi:hypothetical protein A2397_04830 [Candidatus Amesbacteria bacterium RIFOXYB1_FULL_44_23]|uniref:Uncharacterized protein n=1 Tax=Candidatus Amesbacteria bacterium RIFOXYB1_FULL_44_23 TaxID=1797263 RepID=A0A1F4ZUL9_9BACT|nr:MAG: hypothetical protein A2397_04830 [Candidatus Amesbacteria bacterium RIFOXYB1_FULL_44_23]